MTPRRRASMSLTLGMIGAMVYFVGSARSGWDYVLAIPKASVWPVLRVCELFQTFYR